MCYTYDGRAHRGLMHILYYTLVTVAKNVWIEQTKIGCQGNIPGLDCNPISQQSSMPVGIPILLKVLCPLHQISATPVTPLSNNSFSCQCFYSTASAGYYHSLEHYFLSKSVFFISFSVIFFRFLVLHVRLSRLSANYPSTFQRVLKIPISYCTVFCTFT